MPPRLLSSDAVSGQRETWREDYWVWWEDRMRARWGVGRERKQRWRAAQGGPMHGAAGS